MSPADGYVRDYGHQDATGKFLYRDVEDVPSRLALITDPTGTVSVSGSKVIWTRDSGYTFPYNAEVVVRVHSDRIVNASGYQLSDDVYFSFTTEYWPCYGNPTVLRLAIGPLIRDMYDDTLYRILTKNSIRAILEADDNISTDDDRDRPYPAVERFVLAQSIIDVIDELRLLADIQAGQKKQLGDFTVQYQASNPALIAKRAEAVKDRDRALRELRRYRGNLGPRSVVKSEDYSGERTDYRMRTWDSLVASSLPVANTADDRSGKRDLRTDHAKLSPRARRVMVSPDEQIIIDSPGRLTGFTLS